MVSLTTLFLSACGSDATDPNAAQISANNTAKRTCTINSDTNNDGNTDDKYSYTYTNDFKPLTNEIDGGADGKLEIKFLYSYDVNGNNTHSTTIYYNEDGTEDMMETELSYDSKNRVVTISYDNNADGSINSVVSFQYPDSHTTIELIDSNNDGTNDWRQVTIRDNNGNDLEYQTDSNNDGTIDKVEPYTTANAQTTTQMDAQGNIVYSVDLDNDGAIDVKQTIICKDI